MWSKEIAKVVTDVIGPSHFLITICSRALYLESNDMRQTFVFMYNDPIRVRKVAKMTV